MGSRKSQAKTDEYRGTGRTTRMLQQAIDAALKDEGQTVVVIGHNYLQCAELLRRAFVLCDEADIKEPLAVLSTRSELRMGPKAIIKFRSAESPDWDWTTEYFRGYWQHPTFVDHYAREMWAKVPKADR